MRLARGESADAQPVGLVARGAVAEEPGRFAGGDGRPDGVGWRLRLDIWVRPSPALARIAAIPAFPTLPGSPITPRPQKNRATGTSPAALSLRFRAAVRRLPGYLASRVTHSAARVRPYFFFFLRAFLFFFLVAVFFFLVFFRLTFRLTFLLAFFRLTFRLALRLAFFLVLRFTLRLTLRLAVFFLAAFLFLLATVTPP